MERQDLAEVILRRRAENASDHGETGDPEQHLVGEADVADEDQGEHAHQRVDTDLGQEAREDRRGGESGRVIGRRKPEEEREDGGFDAEGHHEHHGYDRHHRLIFNLRHGHGQVGHVERAGHAVENADAGQEQDGRDQVEGHVFDAAVDLLARAAHDQKAEGGDQHHFEPDVEVEEVTGQEGPGHARDQDLEQRVIAEARDPRLDVGHGVDRDRQRGDRGDHDHDGREEVSDECDPEWCGPAAHLSGDDTFFEDGRHEHARGHQHCRRAQNGRPAPAGPVLHQEGQDRCGERDEQGKGQDPAHSSRGSATRISLVSSVPRPR